MCYRIGGNLHRKKILWIGRFSWGRLLWIAHWCCQIMWRPKISWRRLLWIATKPWNLQKFAPSKVSRYIYNIWFLSCLADPWGWVSSGILRDGPWVCPCLLDAARLQIPPPTHHWRRWYTYECYVPRLPPMSIVNYTLLVVSTQERRRLRQPSGSTLKNSLVSINSR